MDLVAELPKDWLDKADVGTVGVLTLDDGECLTAEIVDFNDARSELVVEVVSSKRPHPHNSERGRAIPVSRVVSFEPRSRAEQPWPYSDPCRGASLSFARFVLLATLFLSWTVGSVPLFLLLIRRPYGVQEASVIAYTIFVVFFTFASTGSTSGKDTPRYMFTCPAVQTQVSRLLWCHLGFLVALFALQTAALAVRPNLPDWWNIENGQGRRGGTPFELALLFLCLGLGYAQVFTNRRLLDRAHREFAS
ncbi:MAG: hypothetical protein ACLQBJ_19215 [Bryobacteraceae bacterium]